MSGLVAGERAPSFVAPSPIGPAYAFDAAGGRYALLAFLPPPGPAREAAVGLVRARRELFTDEARLFFGVLPDEASLAAARNDPPCRWLGDASGDLRRLFGAADADGVLVPQWILLDPSMRLMGRAPLDQAAAVLDKLASLGDPDAYAGTPLSAPVLIVPRIFDPDLCERLIALHAESGGEPTGVTRVRDGRSVVVLNDMKRRRDVTIRDEALISAVTASLARRLLPEVRRAFQFHATHIERHMVACYDAAEGGCFLPHRDDSAPATAHRRFAVSINLNAEAFEGGDLRFPEYGGRTYRPPTGGAVVFSCSLLHEVLPVIHGRRYACLPFLYDEAAARLRRTNAQDHASPRGRGEAG